MTWQFFCDYKPWLDETYLYVREVNGFNRDGRILLPAQYEKVAPHTPIKTERAFLGETRADIDDGLGDVTGFLQAAMDCAWEKGLRPKAFKDTQNELIAVRYHLEDMRKMAGAK